MSNCILCKKDMLGIGASIHDYAMGDRTLVGELCEGERRTDEKILPAGAFIDQLNSFNDFYHPEVHKRALELQKAVGDLYA